MSAVLAFDGCYEARRAAALSGVPQSTVYDWARKGVVVPSISAEREKLWSYADLMALRIVSWLRHPKGVDDDQRPAAAMQQVRLALQQLDERRLDLWDGRTGDTPLVVDRSGAILIDDGESTVDLAGRHGCAMCWICSARSRGPTVRGGRICVGRVLICESFRASVRGSRMWTGHG